MSHGVVSAGRARQLVSLLTLAGLSVGLVRSLGGCTSGSDPSSPFNTGGSGGTANSGSGAGTGTTGGAGTGGATGGNAGTSSTGGSGGTGGVNAPPLSWPPPALKLTSIVTPTFDYPVFVTHAPGDSERLFVVERLVSGTQGRIRIIRNGSVQATPFLEVSVRGREEIWSEEGLLGLAFHPNYAANGRFFVYYTNSGGDNVIVSYTRQTADQANAASAQTLLTIPHPYVDCGTIGDCGNHNGGMLAFGPDGLLYVAAGDGGGPPAARDPNANGQNPSTMLGSILRINVDTNFPQPATPQGNTNGYVYDYGLRNPWRFSFDRLLGHLYIADVGHEQREELNVHPAGEGPKNFGWSLAEGTICSQSGCPAGYTAPIHDYPWGSTGQSITGGYVYRGSAISELSGTYFFGDHISRRVWVLQWQDGQVKNQQEITSDLNSTMLSGLSSFGEDAAGELYLVSYDEDTGGVYRIDRE